MENARRVIICASQNIASRNMHQIFVRELGFTPTAMTFDNNPVHLRGQDALILTRGDVLDIEHVCEAFSPSMYIVASSHRSKGPPTHCVHFTGNWASADFGGEPRTLCPAAALQARASFLALIAISPPDWQVCYEVTHHGPSAMNAPLVFVEVGSNETQWQDIVACLRVCTAILAAPEEKPTAVGIGGTHYAPILSKPEILKQYALGHICPKTAVDNLDDELLNQAIQKTSPVPALCLIDWKSLNSAQRVKITGLLSQLGMAYQRA